MSGCTTAKRAAGERRRRMHASPVDVLARRRAAAALPASVRCHSVPAAIGRSGSSSQARPNRSQLRRHARSPRRASRPGWRRPSASHRRPSSRRMRIEIGEIALRAETDLQLEGRDSPRRASGAPARSGSVRIQAARIDADARRTAPPTQPPQRHASCAAPAGPTPRCRCRRWHCANGPGSPHWIVSTPVAAVRSANSAAGSSNGAASSTSGPQHAVDHDTGAMLGAARAENCTTPRPSRRRLRCPRRVTSTIGRSCIDAERCPDRRLDRRADRRRPARRDPCRGDARGPSRSCLQVHLEMDEVAAVGDFGRDR